MVKECGFKMELLIRIPLLLVGGRGVEQRDINYPDTQFVLEKLSLQLFILLPEMKETVFQ